MIDGSNISENLNNEIKTNLKSLNIEFESYFHQNKYRKHTNETSK